MLADPKSRALVDNFASQWLMLRNLQEPHPDAGRLPELRQQAARRRSGTETELFFESIMREDRSVLDLLNADYTFVNERLARHYGIPNVYGSHFRRVTLTQRGAARPARSGQHPDGDVVSEPHVAGAARQVDPREHPRHAAAAAAAERARAQRERGRARKPKSLRARLEAAPREPACATCHRVMDPLGFALENFDGVGEWRVKEPGGTIDPSGQLADGTPVDGPVGAATGAA